MPFDLLVFLLVESFQRLYFFLIIALDPFYVNHQLFFSMDGFALGLFYCKPDFSILGKYELQASQFLIQKFHVTINLLHHHKVAFWKLLEHLFHSLVILFLGFL